MRLPEPGPPLGPLWTADSDAPATAAWGQMHRDAFRGTRSVPGVQWGGRTPA